MKAATKRKNVRLKRWKLRTVSSLVEGPGSIPSTLGSFQPLVTMVPENLAPFFGLDRHQAHTQYIHAYTSETFIHIK